MYVVYNTKKFLDTNDYNNIWKKTSHTNYNNSLSDFLNASCNASKCCTSKLW